MSAIYLSFLGGMIIGVILTRRQWRDNANHVWTVDGKHKVISSETYLALYDEIRMREDK